MYKVKDWPKFQHFKDRRPPWIKLYRDVLEDDDYFELPSEPAKYLMLLWLLASEDKTKQGYLPDIKKISFRLHMNQMRAEEILESLSHYIVKVDDIKPISEGYQSDSLEVETERETEVEKEEISIELHEKLFDVCGAVPSYSMIKQEVEKYTEAKIIAALDHQAGRATGKTVTYNYIKSILDNGGPKSGSRKPNSKPNKEPEYGEGGVFDLT
jgi:hypothetical protein